MGSSLLTCPVKQVTLDCLPAVPGVPVLWGVCWVKECARFLLSTEHRVSSHPQQGRGRVFPALPGEAVLGAAEGCRAQPSTMTGSRETALARPLR